MTDVDHDNWRGHIARHEAQISALATTVKSLAEAQEKSTVRLTEAIERQGEGHRRQLDEQRVMMGEHVERLRPDAKGQLVLGVMIVGAILAFMELSISSTDVRVETVGERVTALKEQVAAYATDTRALVRTEQSRDLSDRERDERLWLAATREAGAMDAKVSALMQAEAERNAADDRQRREMRDRIMTRSALNGFSNEDGQFLNREVDEAKEKVTEKLLELTRELGRLEGRLDE